MVIEFARDVLGMTDANSTEMDPNTPYKVIDLMEEQKNITNMGGSMRLGAYECVLKKGSKAYEAYGKEHIQERHRHRYEFNNEYKSKFEAAGMIVTMLTLHNCLKFNSFNDLPAQGEFCCTSKLARWRSRSSK